MKQHLNWRSKGQGPSIVLIHGFLENDSMWEFCIEELSLHHSVLTVELPGHGLSKEIPLQWSIEQCAQWIWEDLDEKNVVSPILIGHSLGGYVAAQMSTLRLNNVRALILFHSTLDQDNAEKIKIRNRSVIAVRSNKNLYCKTMIKGLFPSKELAIYAEKIDQLADDSSSMTENSIAQTIIAMRDRLSMLKLLKSELKIVYLIGDIDPILPLDKMELELENRGVNVDSVILNRIAHMSHIEDPSKALKAILKAVSLC